MKTNQFEVEFQFIPGANATECIRVNKHVRSTYVPSGEWWTCKFLCNEPEVYETFLRWKRTTINPAGRAVLKLHDGAGNPIRTYTLNELYVDGLDDVTLDMDAGEQTPEFSVYFRIAPIELGGDI
jgi:hypothetical protein